MEVTVGNEELRPTEIGAVGDVPWGTHFFLFYETKEDLLDACVPYLQAGLKSGELCVWVIADPLTEEEARYRLRDAIPGFNDYFESRAIEIVRGPEWYMKGNDFDLKNVIRGWKQLTQRALNEGYAGFRLSADTAWLEKRDWKQFSEYEHEVTDSIEDTRMLALCTYPLHKSSAVEILDVMRTHQFAIARRNKRWEVVETAELKQAKAEILRLKNNLERRVVERTSQLKAANEELRKEMMERQRAEDALRTAEAELARVTRVTAMGELAASIAHELIQPLTGIVANGNACLNWLTGASPDVEKARTTVKRIIRDSNRASEVINNIRALVKKAQPRREPVDLNDLIARTILLAGAEMTRHRVELQTELAAHLPSVMGDPVQLQQVLLNLIINGIEAMSSITGRARILTIRSERRDAVAVTVRDSGVGLDPGEAERMFDAFFTTKPEGMGLGLSICRTIISAHGGRLSSANHDDYGATFEFVLPEDGDPSKGVDTATS
jgi:C4-dicarboxylate-specific signal transduction histidine kinase